MKDARITKKNLRLSGSARGLMLTGPYLTDGHFLLEIGALDAKNSLNFQTVEHATEAGFSDAGDGPTEESIERIVKGIGSKRWTVSRFGMITECGIRVRFLEPAADANGNAGIGCIAIKECILEICGLETGDEVLGKDGSSAFIARSESTSTNANGSKGQAYGGPFRVLMPMRVSGSNAATPEAWPEEPIFNA